MLCHEACILKVDPLQLCSSNNLRVQEILDSTLYIRQEGMHQYPELKGYFVTVLY